MLEIDTLDGKHIEILVWPYILILHIIIFVLVCLIIIVPKIKMILTCYKYNRGMYDIRVVRRLEKYKNKYSKENKEDDIRPFNNFCFMLCSIYLTYGDEKSFFENLNDIKLTDSDNTGIKNGLNYLYISYCSNINYKKILQMHKEYSMLGYDSDSKIEKCISNIEFKDFYNRAEEFKTSIYNTAIKDLFEIFIQHYERIKVKEKLK